MEAGFETESDAADRQLRYSLKRAISKRKFTRFSTPSSVSELEPESASSDAGDIPFERPVAVAGAGMDDTALLSPPPQKRVRSNEWPLKNIQSPRANVESAATAANDSPYHPSLCSRRGQVVSRSPRTPSTQKRSRFTEGKMGDRASARPPKIYIDNNAKPFQPPRAGSAEKENQQPQELRSSSASSSSSESYRFGKAFSWAFKPFRIWKQSKDTVDAVDTASPSNRLARDKDMGVERAYRELKASGYSGAGALKRAASSNLEVNEMDLRGGRASVEGQMDHRASKELPPVPLQQRSGNSVDRRPRKYSSCMNMPSISGRYSADIENQPLLRERPSRRDLDREQKLIKKVSDLEGRLEKAKRQLDATRRRSGGFGQPDELPSKVSAQPMEVSHTAKKRFVPGSLPTLPSERLLVAQADTRKQSPAKLTPITPAPKQTVRSHTTEPRSKKATARLVQDDDHFDAPNVEVAIARKVTYPKSKPAITRKRKTPSPERAGTTRRRTSLTSGSEFRNDNDSSPAIDFDITDATVNEPTVEDTTAALTRRQPSRQAKIKSSYKFDIPIALTSSENEMTDVPSSACCSVEPKGSNPANPASTTVSRPRRRKSNRLMQDIENRTITVTPGKNGDETIPPVPPLPANFQGKAAKKPEYEWPEDIF